MKNKPIIFLNGILIVFLLGVFSCDRCGPFPNKFKVIGLDWNIFKAVYATSADSSLLLTRNDNDTIIYNQYSISIRPRQQTYFAQNANQWNFSLIQPVYACSPNEPTSDETIENIVITSTKDFDSNHSAGTNLADLFDVVAYDQTNYTNNGMTSLKEYLKRKPYIPSVLILFLTKKPNLTTDFTFLVKYYQNGIENNDYFEFLTNKIVIKRDI